MAKHESEKPKNSVAEIVAAAAQGDNAEPLPTAKPLDIDINDPDALRRLAKGKLVEILQTAPVNVSLVAAIRELLDRLDGKPTQSVQMDATVKQITVNATIRFVGNTQPLGDNVLQRVVDNRQVIDNE